MSYALFQVQCRAIELTLALAEREYERYPPRTIIDGVNVGGQFATGKKSGTTLPKAKAIEPKSLMSDAVNALEKTFSQVKGLEAKVERTVAEISKNIVAQYPIDQAPLQLSGVSFAQKLQAAAAQYFNAEDKLLTSNPSEQKKLLGVAIKAAIPLAVTLALTVGVEVAIGMLIGQTIGEAIIGSALVFGVSSATDKVLDIAKVDNPIVRASLQIVAGLATGGLVARSIKIAKVEAGNIASVAEKLLKEASGRYGLRNKILDPHRMAAILERDKIDSEKVLDALYREADRDRRIGKISLHPFSKRLNEYVEIVSDTSDTNSFNAVGAEWRKGIIEAELKYGEIIDKIYTVPIKDVTSRTGKNIYTELLGTIKQGKNGKAVVQKVDQAFVDKYSYLFGKNSSFILEEKRKYRGHQAYPQRFIDQTIDAVSEVTNLAGVDLGKVFVGNVEGSAYDELGLGRAFTMTPVDRNRNPILKFINAGLQGDTHNIGFHEAGHLVEEAKGLGRHSIDFIKDRTTKQKSVVIDGQKVPHAGFLDQYSGKTYSNPYRSEVVSTGIEYLSSFQRLHRMAWSDSDHLRFTLFALDTAIKK